MNVLVVDDEKDLADMLEEEIESRFMCRVDTASNGLDAFIMCQKHPYDLIISDHEMPIMKGSALIIGIRTRENLNQKTPIFMVTAFSADGLDSLPELDGVTFFKKPFKMEEFLRSIGKIIA
ncbi:MAG: hypothetical protein BM556_14225 [Bacteriovorax sp. MedPE-SWde]|nr:MAG: hypothetical protein BM556_14225 [Bacteriovorax sp. MedPE-SWde]